MALGDKEVRRMPDASRGRRQWSYLRRLYGKGNRQMGLDLVGHLILDLKRDLGLDLLRYLLPVAHE